MFLVPVFLRPSPHLQCVAILLFERSETEGEGASPVARLDDGSRNVDVVGEGKRRETKNAANERKSIVCGHRESTFDGSLPRRIGTPIV